MIRPESTTEYRYQLGDQLDEVQTGTELVDYSYDGTLLTQKRYQGELNAAIDYGYNADFAVDALTYAGDTTAIGYDNDGLMTSIHGFTLTYNGLNGLPESISNGSWSQSRSWTPYGEVDDVQYIQGSNTNYAYNLDYNDAGQIIQKTEMLSGGTQDTYVYGYDARNRLIEVQKNGAVVESYGYDANGNRNLRTSTELGVVAQPATHNTGDQLETQGNVTYSYDSNARLSEKLVVDGENSELTTYVYDSAGRLKKVDTLEKSITYRHNALGNRVAKLVDGVLVEKYLWQDLTTLLATYDGQGNLKQRFEHTLGHTPTSFTQGGQRYFIQTDHLGSPRVITDNSGAVVKSIRYDSYGNVISDSNPTFEIPFGFAGGLYDSDTGLVRFGFRDYDPEIGRWTARDPIGFGGGDTNLYGYVLRDPINLFDPLGLWALGDPLPQGLVDGVAGFGDGIVKTLSVGLVSGDNLRGLLGVDGGINKCSVSYASGDLAGTGIATVASLGNAAKLGLGTYKARSRAFQWRSNSPTSKKTRAKKIGEAGNYRPAIGSAIFAGIGGWGVDSWLDIARQLNLVGGGDSEACICE